METILHIGAHRTATTTLQTALTRHRLALRAAGVEVWGPERTRSGLFAGLIHRPEEITEQVEWQAHRSLGLIKVEMERLRAQGLRQLIVTEENMLGAIRGNLRDSLLYPLVDERLRRFVPALAGSLRRIVIGIRAYDTFWTSSLAFGLVQAQRRFPDDDALLRLAAQRRRWRDVIGEVAAQFPGVEILIWRFEELAADPYRQIALMTGGLHLPPAPGGPGLHNPAPGRSTLRRLLHLRGNAEAAQSLEPGDGPWMPFDPAARAAMAAAYAADLQWLTDGADGLARLVAPEINDNNTMTGLERRFGPLGPDRTGGQDDRREHALVQAGAGGT